MTYPQIIITSPQLYEACFWFYGLQLFHSSHWGRFQGGGQQKQNIVLYPFNTKWQMHNNSHYLVNTTEQLAAKELDIFPQEVVETKTAKRVKTGLNLHRMVTLLSVCSMCKDTIVCQDIRHINFVQ